MFFLCCYKLYLDTIQTVLSGTHHLHTMYKTTRSRRQAQRQADYQNEHAPCTPLLSDRSDMLEAGGLPERAHAPCTSILSDTTCWRQADYQNEHAPCTSLLSPIRGGNYCAAQRLQTSDGQAARASRLLALARGRHGDHVQASALTGCA